MFIISQYHPVYVIFYIFGPISFSIGNSTLYNVNSLVGVIIAILLGYLVLTLILGAKRVYFDPFVEKPDDQKK